LVTYEEVFLPCTLVNAIYHVTYIVFLLTTSTGLHGSSVDV